MVITNIQYFSDKKNPTFREAGEGIVPKIKIRLSEFQTGTIVCVTSMAGLFSKKV